MRNLIFLTLATAMLPAPLLGDEPTLAKIDQLLAFTRELPEVERFEIGITRQETPIPALIPSSESASNKLRITIVGRHTDPAPERSTLPALQWFYRADEASGYRTRYSLSVVPLVYPDQWAANAEPPPEHYPPEGSSYQSKTNPEAQYLWNWLGVSAPDLVIVLRENDHAVEAGLAEQLPIGKPALVGSIPTTIVAATGDSIIGQLREVLDRESLEASEARREMERRQQRSALQIARELSRHYGNGLNSVTYIPAVALIGRLRLESMVDDPPQPLASSHAETYFQGNKVALPDRPSGSHLSGHWYFSELARRDGNQQALALAQRAADLGFDDTGMPLESMPAHNEMSDAVFMGCPILVQVGRLTGEAKYFDMALRHFRFMQQHCWREDHLYRHSPLDEAAWGRGNGFPALGLALCLSDLPTAHEAHAAMLTAFQQHMQALAAHQDATGMWHQVIDRPGSYREFSCTCMITFAMLRGVDRGWLDRDAYLPVTERSWRAISRRIATDGTLVDVCTGTGKQRSLRDYLDRKAILGHDARGGAMALLVATEMAAHQRGNVQP